MKAARVGSYGFVKWRSETRLVYACASELLSNLVFETYRSCGDLVLVCGFNSVFEADASDDFGEAIKSA